MNRTGRVATLSLVGIGLAVAAVEVSLWLTDPAMHQTVVAFNGQLTLPQRSVAVMSAVWVVFALVWAAFAMWLFRRTYPERDRTGAPDA